jgi:hypothetical protein
MKYEEVITIIRNKFHSLKNVFNERNSRLWAATEAISLGYGGQSIVAEATGLSRRTIYTGIQELQRPTDNEPKRKEQVRHSGGGRKALTENDSDLLNALEALVEPTSRGNPESPLRWSCKSLRELALTLNKQGHSICYRQVGYLLKSLHYSLQGTSKTKGEGKHPDRNAQFEYINNCVQEFQNRGQPVISVDAKKKELVGDFSNKGREWQPTGKPEAVRVYDFIDKELGKVTPYGVYDQIANTGWISVGTDHDTAAFAVESIRRWWEYMGRKCYPKATELLITADGGGSNGSRNRLWKKMLQQLSNSEGIQISVCHFPPGTSKWNKIEHRMFSYVSINWRGRPLINHETIVNLIANTKTSKGLSIQAELDKTDYPTGIKVSDDEISQLNIKRSSFHGEWNYSISPKEKS